MSWHVFDIVPTEAPFTKTQIKSKISNVTILYIQNMRFNTQPCTPTARLTSTFSCTSVAQPIFYSLQSSLSLLTKQKWPHLDPVWTSHGTAVAAAPVFAVRPLWYWSITETAASPWASQYVLWCQLDVWMMEPLWHLMAAEGLPANCFHMPEDI